MTKIKTANLTGPALDWAVAQAEGHDPLLIEGIWRVIYTIPTTNPDADEGRACKRLPNYTTWQEGGPIIEREGISLYKMGHQWLAGTGGGLGNVFGPTPLIAAMRCYVASRLGDEVDIPDELL